MLKLYLFQDGGSSCAYNRKTIEKTTFITNENVNQRQHHWIEIIFYLGTTAGSVLLHEINFYLGTTTDSVLLQLIYSKELASSPFCIYCNLCTTPTICDINFLHTCVACSKAYILMQVDYYAARHCVSNNRRSRKYITVMGFNDKISETVFLLAFSLSTPPAAVSPSPGRSKTSDPLPCRLQGNS